MAVLGALISGQKVQNSLLPREESSRSGTREGRAVPTFSEARGGVCPAAVPLREAGSYS